jgi:hypothetical protein
VLYKNSFSFFSFRFQAGDEAYSQNFEHNSTFKIRLPTLPAGRQRIMSQTNGRSQYQKIYREGGSSRLRISLVRFHQQILIARNNFAWLADRFRQTPAHRSKHKRGYL